MNIIRMNIIKLLSALIMMFTFGTSTVNAEENTTSIEDKISELAETKTASKSTIKAKVGELSEDELKEVIANVNELTEPAEEHLAIKEAAISKLEEMSSLDNYLLALIAGAIIILMHFTLLW